MVKKIKLIALSGALTLSLVGCGHEYVGEVEGKVYDKIHRPSYTRMQAVFTGKTTSLIPITEPEQHNVYIKYKNLTTSVNNSIIYDDYEIGDTIEVSLYKNSKGFESKIRKR